jgi:hypothetical protein
MQGKRRSRSNNDVDHLKGRIAEALVEGMLMRAGYDVSRTGRESQLPRLFKTGKDEYLPDFMVRKAVERPGSDRPLHQLIPIEVKYRYDIARFLKYKAAEFFNHARRWTGLYLVLVTDNPEPGRSCFQVLDHSEQGGATTRDLEQITVLNIYRSTVLEYEHLGKKLFPLLAGQRATAGGLDLKLSGQE